MKSYVDERQSAQLRTIANILLPGDDESPAAGALPNFDHLLADALEALGPDTVNVVAALTLLPACPCERDLRTLFEEDRASFDIIAATVSGAYFSSPAVLHSIGYPTRRRVAAPFDLAAEQLDGLLE